MIQSVQLVQTRTETPQKKQEATSCINQIFEKVQQSVQNSKFAESMWSKIVAGNKVLSFARTVCRTFPDFYPQTGHMTKLGVLTGGIGLVVNGQNLKNGIKNLREMNQIGDSEGANLAKTRIGSSALVVTSSALSLNNLILEIGKWMTPVFVIIGMIASALSAAGSILGMSISAYRLKGIVDFRKKLNQNFHDPKAQNTAEQARKALEFLKGSLAISQEDALRIGNEIDAKNPNLSTAEKEVLFNQECKKLAQVKVNALKRCSSMKSVQLIAGKAELLLAKLNDPSLQNEAILETEKLVKSILADNGKKGALFVALFIASALVFAGYIASAFFTVGIAPLVLELISSSIGMGAIAIHWIAKKLERAPEMAPMVMPEMPILRSPPIHAAAPAA